MENKISLEDTYVDIINQANTLEIPIRDFFYLLSGYYQCDIASYPKDAGGLPYLEHLFEYQDDLKIYCQETNLLKFNARYNKKYSTLLNKINGIKDEPQRDGLKDSRVGFGIFPTWPANYGILQTTGYHFLVLDHLHVIDRPTGPKVGPFTDYYDNWNKLN
jgi:hypothetical protein